MLLRIDRRHRHAFRRTVEADCMIARTEQIHAAVRAAQRLHALENALPAMEQLRGRIYRERTIRHDRAVVPPALHRVTLHEHAVGEEAPEAELFGERSGRARTLTLRIESCHGGESAD